MAGIKMNKGESCREHDADKEVQAISWAGNNPQLSEKFRMLVCQSKYILYGTGQASE